MLRYMEFKPEIYLGLDHGNILVCLEGVLNHIVRSSISFSDTTKDWNIDQLKSFLNENKISVIKIDRDNCLLARNPKGEIIDETANKAKELSFLDLESIVTLVKLIQQENPLSLEKGKEYKELLFEGFYLDLENGTFYFKCENVVGNFLNRPYYDRKFSFNCTYHEFEQLAKEENIPIYYLDTAKIEFAQIPKSVVSSSQRQHDDSEYQPININDAKSSSKKVIDSEGLLQLFQVIKKIKRPSNNESCDYQQSEPGIIYKKDQPDAWLDFKQDWYSIQKVLEQIQGNNSKEHIDITKKAVEKQVNKLIEINPDLYQKKLIADNDIAKSSRRLLDLSNKGGHKETYVNYAILSELQDYYYSRKTSNYPKSEPQLEYSIPLLSDFLMVKSNPQDKNEVNITINDINAANKKFNRFKSKINDYIKAEISWLENKNAGVKAKVTADIELKSKIKAGWQNTSPNYSLWQEIIQLKGISEDVFSSWIKKASKRDKFIFELQPQSTYLPGFELETTETDARNLLELISLVDDNLREIESFNSELDQINLRSIALKKINEINSFYVQEIKTEDRKLDYQAGVNIPVMAIRDIDDYLKEKVDNIIEDIRLKIKTIKDILDQLTSEVEGIKLIWEDLQDELQYFDYDQISVKNRPQARQTTSEILQNVKTNLSYR